MANSTAEALVAAAVGRTRTHLHAPALDMLDLVTTPTAPSAPAPAVPLHWTPQQALAVFECLHAMRQALWIAYGPEVQQAWRDQLVPDGPMPNFDPDEPF